MHKVAARQLFIVCIIKMYSKRDINQGIYYPVTRATSKSGCRRPDRRMLDERASITLSLDTDHADEAIFSWRWTVNALGILNNFKRCEIIYFLVLNIS